LTQGNSNPPLSTYPDDNKPPPPPLSTSTSTDNELEPAKVGFPAYHTNRDSKDKILDWYAYHRGRAGRESRDGHTGEWQYDVPIATDTNHAYGVDAPNWTSAKAVIRFPLDEFRIGSCIRSSGNSMEDNVSLQDRRSFFRESVPWDFLGKQQQCIATDTEVRQGRLDTQQFGLLERTPMEIAAALAEEYDLTFADCVETADSMQTSLRTWISQEAPAPPPFQIIMGSTTPTVRPTAVWTEMYGHVTAATGPGGMEDPSANINSSLQRFLARRPSSLESSATMTASSSSKKIKIMSSKKRSFPVKRQQIFQETSKVPSRGSNGANSRHKAEHSQTVLLEMSSGPVVVPKVPASDFPCEVSNGIEIDAGTDVDYAATYTETGPILPAGLSFSIKPVAAVEKGSSPGLVIEDGSVDFCNVCRRHGNLLVCDFCPRAFHANCIKPSDVDLQSDSPWKCPSCIAEEVGLEDDRIDGTKSLEQISAVYSSTSPRDDNDKMVLVLASIHQMILRLVEYDFGYAFSEPVDTKQVPDYLNIVERPMDYGTICADLCNGKYRKSVDEPLKNVVVRVLQDVEQVWKNCYLYNFEGSAVYRMALIHEKRAKAIREATFAPFLTEDMIETLGYEDSNQGEAVPKPLIPVDVMPTPRPQNSRYKIKVPGHSYTGLPIAVLDPDTSKLVKVYSTMKSANAAFRFLLGLGHQCEWNGIGSTDSVKKMIRKIVREGHQNPSLTIFGYRWMLLDSLRSGRVAFPKKPPPLAQEAFTTEKEGSKGVLPVDGEAQVPSTTKENSGEGYLQSNGHNGVTSKPKPRSLPNNAILDPRRKLFRLRKSAGGTVSKGAFGVHISDNPVQNCSPKAEDTLRSDQKATEQGMATKGNHSDEQNHLGNTDSENVVQQQRNHETDTKEEICNHNGTKASDWYLFIEEAIYLHERGLLEVYDENETRLEGHDLYRLLPKHEVPLPIYLVYAHLRQQTFKVVRYSAERRHIIHQQLKAPEEKEKLRYSPELRQAAVEARLPPLKDLALHLSWDVYPPDTIFQKRNPGLPHFSVLVTSHTQPFSVHSIRKLVLENEPVPVKIATVAETGTVVLFGVACLSAPSIRPDAEKASDI
jgi:hypothetical protein